MPEVFKYIREMKPAFKSLISELVNLCELLLVLPATNATSERTFSSMCLIKTYLQERLNSLMLIHVHYDKADMIDLKAVANEFVSYKDQRFSFFGKF